MFMVVNYIYGCKKASLSVSFTSGQCGGCKAQCCEEGCGPDRGGPHPVSPRTLAWGQAQMQSLFIEMRIATGVKV